MTKAAWISVATVALAATGCAWGGYDQGPVDDVRHDETTRFNGDWHVVTGRSDGGRDWLDARNQLGVDDNWDAPDRVRYHAWVLPDDFRIEGDRDLLRIEDDGGTLIAEIPLNPNERSRVYERDSGRTIRARWLSDRRFEVERVGRNGRRITQVFTLEGRGRQLVVGTEVERDAGTRSYTRVYDRT